MRAGTPSTSFISIFPVSGVWQTFKKYPIKECIEIFTKILTAVISGWQDFEKCLPMLYMLLTRVNSFIMSTKYFHIQSKELFSTWKKVCT